MPDAAAFEVLAWDSEFFGRRIARAAAHRLDPEGARALVDACRSGGVECLYFLADSNDAVTGRALHEHGFRPVDVRMTLLRDLGAFAPESAAPAAVIIRTATAGDVADLEAIARVNHTDSRFYHDGGFSRERCDALYATWIRRSCEGWADAVFVVEADGRPAGYLSAHVRSEEKAGEIGLIGLADWARGRSLGRALVDHACGWFASRGLRSARVVTQGRNVAALRLYERSGFLVRTVELWYHRWFERQPPA